MSECITLIETFGTFETSFLILPFSL